MDQAVRNVTSSLALTLRDATRQDHADAERAGIMPMLLRGELPLPAYRALLLNLRAIYSALEPELASRRSHPCVAPIWFPALCRRDAIDDDLKTLAALGGDRTSPLRPATHAYVRHIEQIATHEPELLVAHAYVRYLGDLSGGQILARIVARAYGLSEGRGTRFYDFGNANEAKALGRALRDGLDAVPADGERRAAIVAEARDAFARHQALFIELQA